MRNVKTNAISKKLIRNVDNGCYDIECLSSTYNQFEYGIMLFMLGIYDKKCSEQAIKEHAYRFLKDVIYGNKTVCLAFWECPEYYIKLKKLLEFSYNCIKGENDKTLPNDWFVKHFCICEYDGCIPYEDGEIKVVWFSEIMEKNMKFDLVVSNPPYDGDLHLQILDTFLKIAKTCVFIHPARWMEDVLAQYKAKSATGKKFEHLKTALEKAYLIKSRDADHVFHILNNQDMLIGVYSDSDLNPNVSIYDDSKQFFDVLKSVISYAHNVKSLGDVVEDNLIDGVRVEVKGILPILNHVDSELVKGYPVRVVWNVISIDGYTEDGQFWANANKRNTKTHGKKIGTPIPHSIKFNTKEEAQTFIDLYRTNVVKNIIYMLKYDQHSGHTHIPYFDPKTIKTEDDVLDALGITEPEYREWLKRKVYDYREKDFIKYGEWIDC